MVIVGEVLEVHLAEVDGATDVDHYNEPLKLLLIQKVTHYGDQDLIQSHVSFEVSVKSGKSISVVRSRFIVEERDQHKYNEVAQQGYRK